MVSLKSSFVKLDKFIEKIANRYKWFINYCFVKYAYDLLKNEHSFKFKLLEIFLNFSEGMYNFVHQWRQNSYMSIHNNTYSHRPS
jgi:hypothetical protein